VVESQQHDEAAALRGRVFEEQTKALYAKGPIALAVNLVNSLVVVIALWDAVPRQAALAWLVTMYVTVALRLEMIRRHDSEQARPYRARHWARLWTGTTAVTGALWGTGGVLLYPGSWPGGQDLLLFVIGGMVGGASASMSSYLPAFAAFTIPTLVPPVLRLLAEEDRPHRAMAFLLCVFGLGMTAVARSGSRSLAAAIRLRVKNEQLAADLSSAHERLLRLNRELEERVAARTAELEAALRARADFVSVVSHELRSPLGAMVSSLEVLRMLLSSPAPDRPRLQRAVDVLSRQLGRTSRVVDDLLDVSRLSAERMVYAKSPVDLREIVGDSLEGVATQLATMEARVEVRVDDGLRGNWDRLRIQQVLVNLVSNALKYGSEPYSLTAERVGGKVRIVVHDEGPGIPADHLQSIFEAFQRGPSSGAQGLGLGLYISERIARAHGGSICAYSKPGQGTSFVVDLPVAG
jgi:signal transduction histidine kinase